MLARGPSPPDPGDWCYRSAVPVQVERVVTLSGPSSLLQIFTPFTLGYRH